MFREAGAPDPIQLVGDCYRLNAEWSVWTDTREFEVLARRALSGAESNDEMRIETIGKAIELYSGDYLDTDPYESWTEDLRRHRRRLHTDLLELQSRLLLNTGRLTEAISACRTILRVEPTNESGHRRLMVALMRQGRSTDALDAYEHCRSTLGDELGMTPSPETERAYECILRNESL